MFCEINELNHFVSDAPFASEPSASITPHTAPDGTTPDGMRKARFAGVWDEAAGAWVGGSWVDEEAAELAAEQFAAAVTRKMDEIRTTMDAALATGFTCTNGITMDATDEDARKLDAGSRLAARLGQAIMDVRDHHNVRHPGIPLDEVDTMVNDLGLNWLDKWNQKCYLQEAVTAIASRTELDPTDPDYLDPATATEALKAI